MNRTSLRAILKRIVSIRLREIVWAIWAVLVAALFYLLLRAMPIVEAYLPHVGISMKGALSPNLLATAISTIAGAISYRGLPTIQRVIGNYILPVNRDISSVELDELEAHYNAVRRRVTNLIPLEQRPSWNESPDNQRKLGRLMIPLPAHEIPTLEAKNKFTAYSSDTLTFLDRELFTDPSRRIPPMVVQGDPGSGKSTVLFELFREYSQRLRENRRGWIPVLIFVHDLSWDEISYSSNLEDLLTRFFIRSDNKPVAEFIRRSYKSHQFLLIIDGLDEFSNRQQYTAACETLNRHIEEEWNNLHPSQAPNRYLVSCRTDDNQRKIAGRLLSIDHISPDAALQHLRRLRRYYAANNNNREKANELADTIEGLELSRSHRLLQNYMGNPYLLYLITEYYSQHKASLATTLNKVFGDVLRRELEKAAAPTDPSQVLIDISDIAKYVRSLLGPYCFIRTVISPDQSGADIESALLMANVLKDPELADLMNDGEDYGYLRSLLGNDSVKREEAYHKLASRWGTGAVSRLRDHVTPRLLEGCSFGELSASALEYLYRDVFYLLEKSGLAEIDHYTLQIARFRHRRMQEYFTSLYIDRVGLTSAMLPHVSLGNAWMREPLRILAAISRRPTDLIVEFNKSASVQLEQEDMSSEAELNKVVDLIVNGSEAVAYLPSTHPDLDLAELQDAVLQLGYNSRRVLDFAFENGKNWLSLQYRALKAVCNIYGSEFLIQCGDVIFAGEVEHYWTRLHHRIQLRSDSFQHTAYTYLFPVHARHRGFPIRGASLFYYVFDAVLCFRREFERLIVPTHHGILRLLPLRLASYLEALVAMTIAGIGLIKLFGIEDTASIPGALFNRLAWLVLFVLPVAWGVQLTGLMSMSSSYQLPVWSSFWIWKRIWPRFRRTVIAARVTGAKTVRTGISSARTLLQEMPRRRVIHAVGRSLWTGLTFIMVWPAILVMATAYFLYWILRDVSLAIVNSGRHSGRRLAWLAFGLMLLIGAWMVIIMPMIRWAGSRSTRAEITEYIRIADELDTHWHRTWTVNNTSLRKDADEIVTEIKQSEDLAQQLKSLVSRGESLSVQYQSVTTDESVPELEDRLSKLRQDSKEADTALVQLERRRDVIFAEQRANEFLRSVAELRPTLLEISDEITGSIELAQDIPASAAVARSRALELLSLGELVVNDRMLSDSPLRSRALEQSGEMRQQLEILETVPEVRASGNVSSLDDLVRTIEASDNYQAVSSDLKNIGDFVASDGPLLESIVVDAISSNVTAMFSAESDRHEANRQLVVVKKAIELEARLPQLRDRLEQLDSEAIRIKGTCKRFHNLECEKRTNSLLSELERSRQQVAEGEALFGDMKLVEMRDLLENRLNEATRQAIYFSNLWQGIIVVFLVIAIWVWLARRHGDKTGLKEVKKRSSDINKLLDFLRDNKYSASVNELAIAHLRYCLTAPSVETAKYIASVAAIRLARPGEINERIGSQLQEIAVGIENTLNRP